MKSSSRSLLENSPPCLVINRAADILYIHGRTGKYLEPPRAKWARPTRFAWRVRDLRSPLSAAVARAISEKQAVTYDRVQVKTNGDEMCLRLTVRPLLGCAGQRKSSWP